MHSHHKDQTTAQRMSKVLTRNKVARREEDGIPTTTHEYTNLRSIHVIERLGGNIRSGSLEYFFDHVLPPTKPELDVDRIYDTCIKKKILSKKMGSEEYTWVGVRKNSKGNKAHKTRFINIFRVITEAARGVTSTHFDILNNSPKVKSRRNKNKDPDAVIYLGNSLERQPNISEERRLCATSFSFHFKNSNDNDNAYDVRSIPFTVNNTNAFCD